MADESATRLDGEVEQECRVYVNELPSSQAPKEKRTMPISERFMESNILFANQRSIHLSYYNKEPISTQSSVDKASYESTSDIAKNWINYHRVCRQLMSAAGEQNGAYKADNGGPCFQKRPDAALKLLRFLEWLKKIEQISDRFLERVWRVYTQLVIYDKIFFWLFDEYPNGIRHLCTTMPWTIWPALVVLWGVCWMFYSEPVLCAVAEAEAERTLPPDHQEQLLDFQDGFLGIDCGIDLPDTSLLNDTTAFSWDFWSDIPPATYDWGVIDQQVQIDEAAAPSSVFAISPTITLLQATTPNRNELVDANQSTVDDSSHIGPIVSLESAHECQTKANSTKQTAATSIQPRRIYTRPQQGSFNCPNCDGSFTRLDSLRRHVSAKHVRDKEFLCSNSSCERSKKGQGFNRRDKWKAHENSTCRSRSRSHSSSSSGAGISSEAAPQLDSIANASLECQESSGATWINGTVGPGSGALQNQDGILELRKLCQAKKEALLIKEKQCEDERKVIAHLIAAIELLEGSNTVTSI